MPRLVVDPNLRAPPTTQPGIVAAAIGFPVTYQSRVVGGIARSLAVDAIVARGAVRGRMLRFWLRDARGV